MQLHSAPDRSYRCFLDYTGLIAESGVRPFVQLKAPSACRAAHLARAVTGAQAVVEVIRLEEPRA